LVRQAPVLRPLPEGSDQPVPWVRNTALRGFFRCNISATVLQRIASDPDVESISEDAPRHCEEALWPVASVAGTQG